MEWRMNSRCSLITQGYATDKSSSSKLVEASRSMVFCACSFQIKTHFYENIIKLQVYKIVLMMLDSIG